MAIGSATNAEVGKSDPIITRLANEDKVPFYRKPNLLYLYLMLFPTCMGIELTSVCRNQNRQPLHARTSGKPREKAMAWETGPLLLNPPETRSVISRVRLTHVLQKGFDSQLINALQIVPAWKTCRLPCLICWARRRLGAYWSFVSRL